MKARTQAQKRRDKARRKIAGLPEQHSAPEAVTATVQSSGADRHKAIRPTPERLSRGAFRMPKGVLRHEMPAHDEAHDALAMLRVSGLIGPQHESFGRDWQKLKAEIHAHLGVGVTRSCLDDTPRGHSDDDGDPDLMKRWRDIEARLGPWRTGSLDWTCVLGNLPQNMGALRLLRSSLNALGSC